MKGKKVIFAIDRPMLEEFNAAVVRAGATKSGTLRRLIFEWLREQRGKAEKGDST